MHVFSTPTAINLELTETCNVKCRHCYNYWRDENSTYTTLSAERLDFLIDMMIEAGVFHVVLTGGEPLTCIDLLEHGIRRLTDKGISISVNSNLMLATNEKLRRLRDLGVDHILTSLNSHDPEVNDLIVNQQGAFAKIVKGIGCAIDNDIRVSVNMIVSQLNKGHVYPTGKLVSELGAQKIFGTRVVPSVHNSNPSESSFHLTREDALLTLDQLVKIKQETGIMIGTLVSYPLCLLSDLEKYKDFVGRGCPGQAGHVISINATGNSHACVHQEEGFGNVFEIGIKQAYKNMLAWHDGSLRHKACIGCDYLEICMSGCRMSAQSYFGVLDGPDNLMIDKNNFVKPYQIVYDQSIYQRIDQGLQFVVPQRIRIRKEEGFTLLNIRWANTITCPTDVAEVLQSCQLSGEPFTIDTLGHQHRETLAKLYFKDAVECHEITYHDQRDMLGLSTDII